MSSKTPNFNLHKIDLQDSPPDITVLNQNFDIIDEELAKGSTDALPLTGGTLTGPLYFEKDGERKGWIEPVTGEHELNVIATNDPEGTIRYLNINAEHDVETKNAINFIDNSTIYKLYGEHNKDTMPFARCNTPLTLNVTSDGILQIIY